MIIGHHEESGIVGPKKGTVTESEAVGGQGFLFYDPSLLYQRMGFVWRGGGDCVH